jgi:D-serine deaminase-like pyridoxal phosphate-dependent protein
LNATHNLQGLSDQSISAIQRTSAGVDLDVMERNLSTMAAFASHHKVQLQATRQNAQKVQRLPN